LDIPGKGRHDVLFVATEHDSICAFDAYGHPASPLWRVNFLRKGVTTVPEDDVECPFIVPEVGITSTPVIDADTETLYVLARTKERTRSASAHYTQRLHALAVTTGLEKFGGPVDIKATINGRGTGSQSGKVEFDPLRENPRASLLLANGSVYLTWASSCDVGPYHGWVMAYDAHTLKQKAVFNASPDGDDSGIWAGDTAPVADARGNVFLATGNGRFDAVKGGRDYGDSLLKLDGQSAPSARNGAVVFHNNCLLCHSLEPGQNGHGPSLAINCIRLSPRVATSRMLRRRLLIRMVVGYSELIAAEWFLVAEVRFELTTFGL
jgi:hypothetical protein